MDDQVVLPKTVSRVGKGTEAFGCEDTTNHTAAKCLADVQNSPDLIHLGTGSVVTNAAAGKAELFTHALFDHQTGEKDLFQILATEYNTDPDFKVSPKNNATDSGRIWKSNLKEYIYLDDHKDRIAGHPSIDVADFTAERRQAVDAMLSEWNNGSMIALRGTTAYPNNNERDTSTASPDFTFTRTSIRRDFFGLKDEDNKTFASRFEVTANGTYASTEARVPGLQEKFDAYNAAQVATTIPLADSTGRVTVAADATASPIATANAAEVTSTTAPAPIPAVETERVSVAATAVASESTAPPERATAPAAQADLTGATARDREQKLVDLAIQQANEGPYQAAQRLLPNATPKQILELAHQMKASYQQATGDSTDNLEKLPVGYNWINAKNIQDMLQNNALLKARFEAASADPPKQPGSM